MGIVPTSSGERTRLPADCVPCGTGYVTTPNVCAPIDVEIVSVHVCDDVPAVHAPDVTVVLPVLPYTVAIVVGGE